MSFADQGIVTSKAITTESPQNSARWITPRNVLRLGIAVVALHIFQEAFLDAAASSLIANLLQIFSALLAATTCFVCDSKEFRLHAVLLALDRTELPGVDGC